MTSEWGDCRKEYRYAGFLFSPDGRIAREGAIEYREIEFSAGARRRFRLWLAVVIAFTFPGIPLLASTGLGDRLFWIVVPALAFAWWLHRRIHACPQCGGQSRELRTPHMDAPVLHLCPCCHTFFEHGTIDGGWPGK